jgi:hypothetical protein
LERFRKKHAGKILRVNNFLRSQKFTNKTHFEILKKNESPLEKYYEFIGYKWFELKDVPILKRIGYIYHIPKDSKNKFKWYLFTALFSAGLGAFVTYLVKG